MRFVLSPVSDSRPGAPRPAAMSSSRLLSSFLSSGLQTCCTPFYHPRAESLVEVRGFPPIRQKAVEWMGHGGLRCFLLRSVGFPIDDGWAEAADGVAEIDGVGLAEVFDGQDLLMRVGVGFQDVAAVDAGE